jgi:hypothetical protein
MTNNNLPAPSSPCGSALDKLAYTVRHVVDLAAGPIAFAPRLKLKPKRSPLRAALDQMPTRWGKQPGPVR